MTHLDETASPTPNPLGRLAAREADPPSAREPGTAPGPLGRAPVAAAGCDVVALTETGAPLRGSRAFVVNWRGYTWLFMSAERRNRFVADPAHYVSPRRVHQLASGRSAWRARADQALSFSRAHVADGLALFVTGVFGQALAFKLSDAAETRWVFDRLEDWAQTRYGVAGPFTRTGPFGPLAVGAVETVAGALLVAGVARQQPALRAAGAALSLAVMAGALPLHALGPLGLEVEDGRGRRDGGLLFGLACATAVASIGILARDAPAAVGGTARARG